MKGKSTLSLKRQKKRSPPVLLLRSTTAGDAIDAGTQELENFSFK